MIDTHAHLTSEALLPHLHGILERAKACGIKRIINICTDEKSLIAGLDLAKRDPMVSNSAATTPHDVDQEGESFFPYVEKCAKEGLLVAIGETGLDYFYSYSKKETQQAFLLRYFALAKEVELPLIFHCREAFADLFAHADREYQGRPAVLHCFTGTLEEARGVLDRGWHLSLSGIVTFKKSVELRKVAEFVPLDRLFLETDAPYLAPEKHRGRQNEPSYLVETAALVAEIKGIPANDLIQRTAENALHFFRFQN